MPDQEADDLVTFLFTDIEDSTRRWEHRRDAMSTPLAAAQVVCAGDGGTVQPAAFGLMLP